MNWYMVWIYLIDQITIEGYQYSLLIAIFYSPTRRFLGIVKTLQSWYLWRYKQVSLKHFLKYMARNLILQIKDGIFAIAHCWRNCFILRRSFRYHWLMIFKVWRNDYIHYNGSDWITYTLPNFNASTVEDWEVINTFNIHLTWHVIANSWWD